MRHFTGTEGDLYLLGEAMRFTQEPLTDCGDGFDWRIADPSLRFWDDSQPLLFESYEDGAWTEIRAERLEPTVGRVGFGRCLTGGYVRASGTSRPTTLLCSFTDWTLGLAGAPVADRSTLGDDEHQFESLPSQPRARITVASDAAPVGETDELFVIFKCPPGALVGCGIADADTSSVINFDEGGVNYVLC